MSNDSDAIFHAQSFAEHLLQNRGLIHSVLEEYESYEVIEDEITRSVDVLNNIDKLKDFFSGHVLKTSVFLPLNLPLYSFVLFAAVPSYQSWEVFVRPPARMTAMFSILCEKLSFKTFFPAIFFFSGTRDAFVENNCKKSDVVIFTGRYDNFLKIKSLCGKNILILYNGAGHNPIVVTETADIDMAVEKTAYVKLFNNGQDCAGSDAILVHTGVIELFTKKLIKKLHEIRVGKDYKQSDIKIGPLSELSALTEFSKIISRIMEKGGILIYGGIVDYKNNIIQPCICRQSIRENVNYEEIYSPLFPIIEYFNDEDLDIYFNDPGQRYAQGQMYVSLFGHSEYIEKKVLASIILNDLTIHDVERGIQEYGGYGVGASGISYRGITIAKPILIPREIHTYLLSDYRKVFMSTFKTADPEKEIIEALFKKTVVEIFAEDLIFAYIFGSYARNREKSYSDVDTFICVKKKSPEKIKKYILWIFNLCEVFGKIPDFNYPAEIVEIEELKNAIKLLPQLTLSAGGNPSRSYDMLVWTHSLSHYKIGIVKNENIPNGWEAIFPENSSRILKSFLDSLGENLLKKKIPDSYEKLQNIPNDKNDIENFIKNLGNGRKLIDLFRYVPFQGSAPYKKDVMDILSKKRSFGKKFVKESFMKIKMDQGRDSK
jgi:aldehyde dehydrogenase (NAD+)